MRVRSTLLSIFLSGLPLTGWGQPAAEAVRVLDAGWQYRQAGAEAWSAATVPGCVHTDLLADGRIEDPSYRLNEADQQWVGYSDWEYRTSFDVPAETLSRQHVRLVFDGLDTYAEVFLNGRRILSADNMFRTWRVSCKESLRPGSNELRVLFRNVFSKTLPRLEASPFPLQAFTNNDQAKVKVNMYARKAGFHFGWDWGPRLITCGVWRPVRLESWDGARIESVFYEQTKVSAERADLVAQVELVGDTNVAFDLVVRGEEGELARKSVSAADGRRIFSLPFSVDEPRLWWTHDLGEQPLYEFTAETHASDQVVSSNTASVGLRELKVVRERDKDGKSMYVELNGVPLFIKGANYIPQDNFQSRVSGPDYGRLLGAARDANMNMLRVWGGGIYEEDAFYHHCDRAGILVWQDTMFACAMYPADEAFLQNVRAEVVDNAKRLRNHPSVALYCGNNEVEISWHEWGWKDKYSESEQRAYEDHLRQLFYETIPSALAEADPSRYYHPSSPVAGFAGRPNGDGDLHYWGVWHGKEPFEDFEKNVGRFMSEYGFQSYPDITTVSRYTAPADRRLDSDVMHAHQRSRADEGRDVDYGNRLINDYLARYFPEPAGFDEHLLMTQLVQAYGVQTAIESHRRRKPYCMGTLYWQINDCWPVASWSSIDYYGRWKALHYVTKRAYEPTALSTVQRPDRVEVHVMSDHVGADIEATLEVEVLDLEGQPLWTKSMPVVVSGEAGRLVADLPMDEIADGPRHDRFLSAKLTAEEELIAEVTHCFVPPKSMELSDPQITWSAQPIAGGYEIRLSAERFASYAFVETNDGEGRFSNNFFALAPGGERSIRLLTDKSLEEHGGLVARSLYDLVAKPGDAAPSPETVRNASSASGAVGR